jgi:hypothetical protein
LRNGCPDREAGRSECPLHFACRRRQRPPTTRPVRDDLVVWVTRPQRRVTKPHAPRPGGPKPPYGDLHVHMQRASRSPTPPRVRGVRRGHRARVPSGCRRCPRVDVARRRGARDPLPQRGRPICRWPAPRDRRGRHGGRPGRRGCSGHGALRRHRGLLGAHRLDQDGGRAFRHLLPASLFRESSRGQPGAAGSRCWCRRHERQALDLSAAPALRRAGGRQPPRLSKPSRPPPAARHATRAGSTPCTGACWRTGTRGPLPRAGPLPVAPWDAGAATGAGAGRQACPAARREEASCTGAAKSTRAAWASCAAARPSTSCTASAEQSAKSSRRAFQGTRSCARPQAGGSAHAIRGRAATTCAQSRGRTRPRVGVGLCGATPSGRMPRLAGCARREWRTPRPKAGGDCPPAAGPSVAATVHSPGRTRCSQSAKGACWEQQARLPCVPGGPVVRKQPNGLAGNNRSARVPSLGIPWAACAIRPMSPRPLAARASPPAAGAPPLAAGAPRPAAARAPPTSASFPQRPPGNLAPPPASPPPVASDGRCPTTSPPPSTT